MLFNDKYKIESDKLNVTIAGLPKKQGKYITFENFNKGLQILASDTEKEHKLTFKHVKGGVKLVETDFTIKYDKKLKQSIKML